MEILTDRDVESASSAREHEGLCFSCVKDFANKILATKSNFKRLVKMTWLAKFWKKNIKNTLPTD
jgi:hypothetical protein